MSSSVQGSARLKINRYNSVQSEIYNSLNSVLIYIIVLKNMQNTKICYICMYDKTFDGRNLLTSPQYAI